MFIKRCSKCGTYTLKEKCPKCGTPTSSAHPFKFSLEKERKYAKYRKV